MRGAPARRDVTPRGGFSLIEVLVVLVVLSILVRLALPSIQTALLEARAAEAFGDLRVVEVAARQYNADGGGWPPDARSGEVPPDLVPYLPDGFTFTRDSYELDWENWTLPDGLPEHPETGMLLGVSIATDREELGNAVSRLLGPNGWYTLGNRYTRLLERG